MYHFIINPTAKRGKNKKLISEIKELIASKNIDCKLHYTEHPKHATEIAKSLTESGQTNIIAVGGDGTIHEVLNGLSNIENVNFGIIPCGSGNDFVTCAKIPADCNLALDLILNNEPVYTDFFTCDNVRGINVMGIGIDVDVLKRIRKNSVFKGKMQYFYSLLISLIKFKFYNIKVVKDKGKTSKKALIACVGNGNQFGGGIKLTPRAKLDDGKLDFVVANELKKYQIPGKLIKLMKGKIDGETFIDYEFCDTVNLELEKGTTIQVDGEIYEDINYNVKIHTNTLKMFRPH